MANNGNRIRHRDVRMLGVTLTTILEPFYEALSQLAVIGEALQSILDSHEESPSWPDIGRALRRLTSYHMPNASLWERHSQLAGADAPRDYSESEHYAYYHQDPVGNSHIVRFSREPV